MNSDTLFIYIVIAAILLVLVLFIARWIFRFDKMIKYQQGVISTLFEIAKAQGVPQDRIDGIINTIRN